MVLTTNIFDDICHIFEQSDGLPIPPFFHSPKTSIYLIQHETRYYVRDTTNFLVFVFVLSLYPFFLLLLFFCFF